MFTWKNFIILLFIYAFPNLVILAYEVETHELITRYSIDRSDLANPTNELLLSLGFEQNIYDANQKFPNSIGEKRTIFELIEFGARFEDNTDEIFRPLRHFYDPQNGGRPLTVSLFGAADFNSLNWILDETAIFQFNKQNFSYSDANKYFYRALTSLTKEDRDDNWGLTFQTLGQVIHHIQDMAQPQHVRNDDHCSDFGCRALNRYKPSAYEKYTAENHDKLNEILNSSNYPDIDLNIFNTPRIFWDGEGSNNGRGLAEFSSNNFVSAGTNFIGGVLSGNTIINAQTHPEYAFPSTNNIQVTSRNITDADLLGPQTLGQPLIGKMHFIGTQVTDTNIPSESRVNPRTSSFSIFDSDLETWNSKRTFTLNRFNYDTAHQFLLPRAVAYSAGLINYFFRGRIEVSNIGDVRDHIYIKIFQKIIQHFKQEGLLKSIMKIMLEKGSHCWL